VVRALESAVVPTEETQPEIVATASTVVYRNRWMTVREDRVRRRDGGEGSYGVVQKPDFALVVPFERGGYHLVEQFRYPVGARYWEFPQGSREGAPELAAVEVARAELAEETGLRAGSLALLGRLHAAYGYSDQGFQVFLATQLTPGEQRLDAEEGGLVTRWFIEDELWELVAAGRFTDAPSLAALALFDRRRRAAAGATR